MAKKTLSQTIREAYPELEGKNLFEIGVVLQNDSDGEGDYIAAWDFDQPIPDGLKLGK
jgi:hypothetical protein